MDDSVVKRIVSRELQSIVKTNNSMERMIRFQVILTLLQDCPEFLTQRPKFHKALTAIIEGSPTLKTTYQDLCISRQGYNLRVSSQ